MEATPKVHTEQVEHVPIGSVHEHPENPRDGDVEMIAESIRENGFFGTLVVQESTNRILVGNHRWLAAQLVGLDTVPVLYVDVDDEQALRILLADNRTSDVADYQDDQLADLLQELNNDYGGLFGTGYEEDDLNELLYDLGRTAPDFDPVGADEQGKLDETDTETHTCPKCGHEFEA